ncbi:MAG TPA: biotin/lipoyl-containing protein [Propionicimonas sp.]|jgi:glutaconyl-CoA decarboxylase
MRRYTVRINDTDHVLDVEELARDTFTVHLEDGRLVDVILTDHQDLAQAVIAPQLEIGHVRTAPVPATLPLIRTSAASAHPAATPVDRAVSTRGGSRTVTSPMPGVLLSIDVAVGAVVTRGQTLMVLEAMKMKNEIKAQRDGTIAAIRVGVGDQVRHGDALLEFES